MKLHLVRHLAPVVAPATCYGRTDLAVPAQALALAAPAIRAALPAGAPVLSSPMRRCVSLSAALSPNVRYDARLVELDFGSWEMRAWDAIARAEIDAWAADVARYRPGGGESVADMAERIDAFYTDLMREPWPEAVIVCHAGVMRLMAARSAGLSAPDMAREAAERPHAIGYGEIMVLDCV